VRSFGHRVLTPAKCTRLGYNGSTSYHISRPTTKGEGKESGTTVEETRWAQRGLGRLGLHAGNQRNKRHPEKEGWRGDTACPEFSLVLRHGRKTGAAQVFGLVGARQKRTTGRSRGSAVSLLDSSMLGEVKKSGEKKSIKDRS